MTGLLYAQTGGQQVSQGMAQYPLVPIILIMFIVYFLILRPQQKRLKEHQTMLKALKKGDQVVTSGGIYGAVTAIKGNVVELKIAEGCKINVSKGSISSLQEKSLVHDKQEG